MKHKIKMIGMDLDGTLLTTEKHLTDRTRNVLEEAIRRGIIVLPATGRPLCGLPKEVMAIEGIRYAVTSNGARVMDMKEDKVIEKHLLPVEKARRILEILEKYDTLREVYFDGIGYAQEDALEQLERYQETPAMADYVRSTRVAVPDVREKFEQENRDVDKTQGVFACMKERARALEEVRSIPDIEVTESLKKNIEVNGKGVHKGNAVLSLGKYLGISEEEILVFGDSSNDTDMIRMAGVGVAMANSKPEVIEAADYVTASNDEDGVAAFIETYVLGSE